MLNKIIAWIVESKIGGAISKVKSFLLHKKTYALGTLTCMQGIVGLWDSLANLANTEQLIEFVKTLGSNPDWKMILAGLAMFTVRAAIAKSAPAKPEFDNLGEAKP